MKMIFKNILALLLSFVFVTTMKASAVDIYLNSAYHDRSKVAKEALFEQYKYKRNYIDKLRSKVEVSHWDDTELKYSLQAFPKSFSELDIEEKIYHIKKAYSIGNLDNSKTLKSRYNILLDAWYQNQLMTSTNKVINLYHDKLRVAKSTLVKGSDIEDLVKIKNKLNSLDIEVFKREQKYKNLLNIMQRDLNSSENIDSELKNLDFINDENIMKNIKNILAGIEYLPKKKDLFKVELLEQKVALEDVKNAWKVRSLDFDYDDSKRIKNAFSVAVSVEIPLSEDSKQLESRLKLIEAKDKVVRSEERITKEMQTLKDEMTYLQQYKKKINASFINVRKYIQFSKLDGVDPQFLLDLQRENLGFEVKNIKANYAMYKTYIDFLDFSGKFKEVNTVNLLLNRK